MKPYGMLCGPLAAAIFVAGVAGLAMLVPGYSHVHQTMSEIGEIGSPVQTAFTAMALVVAVCILIFALALRKLAIAADRSTLAAYLTVCMAVSLAGVGIFSFPHPLHNVFGISELIGYQAPLALALTWHGHPRAGALVVFSWIISVAVWIALALNLASLVPDSELWRHVHPMIGIAQRMLFGAWFLWCAVVGALLFQNSRHPAGVRLWNEAVPPREGARVADG